MMKESTNKTNLYNVPQEVALSIAAEIRAWTEEDFASRKNHNFSAIDQYSAFSSLTLLNHASNEVWISMLLEEVQLTPTTLHCIYRCKNGLQIDPHKMVSDGITHLNVEGSKALSSLHKVFSEDPKILKDDPTRSKYPDLHKYQVATGLAFIIDSVPNLQSLKVNGKVLFPLCKRISTDTVPLLGLSNLKVLKLARSLEAGLIMSGRNLIWLLALPNIEKGGFCISLGKKDVKYLRDHGEVLNRGISKIKDLEVVIQVNSSVIGLVGWQETLQIITSSIVELEHFKLKVDTPINLVHIVDGLSKHSISSLSSLSLKIEGVHPASLPAFPFRLNRFRNLRVVQSDAYLIDSLLSASDKLFKEGVKPQVLPPSLEIYKIKADTMSPFGGFIRDQKATEIGLATLLRLVAVPSTLNSIVSFVHKEEAKVVTSSSPAVELGNVCSNFSIKHQVLPVESGELF